MFVIGFEIIFEKCLCLGELCNDSRSGENVYKVLTFENISFEIVGVFEICFVLKCLQAINYKCSTYLKESICSFPPPLDSAFLPLVSRNPYH